MAFNVYLRREQFAIPATAIVELDENNVATAVDGWTKQIIIRTDDHAEAIQEAIDYLHDRYGRGLVQLGKGEFHITDTITLKPYIHIRGVGRGATILKLGNDVNKTILATLKDVLYWMTPTIADLTIDGNKKNNDSGNGIEIYNSMHGALLNVDIRNCPLHGIYCRGRDSSLFGVGLRLVNVNIEECGGSAIFVDPWFFDLFIVNSNFGRCGYREPYYNGLVLPEGSIITNSHVWENKMDGIITIGGTPAPSKILIHGCIIEKNGGQGVHIEEAHRVIVEGCYFYSNYGNGVFLRNTYHNIIIGNVLMENSGYGITEDSETDLNIIVGNRLINNGKGEIRKTGAHTIVKHNLGFPTESQGVTSITGDGSSTTFTVDVDHGLVNDKVAVKVGCRKEATYKWWLVDTDGDGFHEKIRIQLTFAQPPASGETVDIFWCAEAVV